MAEEPVIARLLMLLPFDFAVPDGAQFRVLDYEEDGYVIQEYPPFRTDRPLQSAPPETMTLNGVQAFLANGLRIDFRKHKLDRRTSMMESDPPRAFVIMCAERLLKRLRFLTSAPQIQLHALRTTSWRLQYLKDDGSEFEPTEGLVRARVAAGFSFSFVGLTPAVWDQMQELGPEFEPRAWNTLLLDAQALMPNIGAAITLTATALEVFIAHVLDELVKASAVPAELWSWINGRDYLKQPSTEEQFDQLLHVLCGHSLKEETTLWEAFKNVRGARNTFVHEGAARVGKDLVTEPTAGQLILRATEIIKKIRAWLPENMRWPQPHVEVKVEASHNLGALVTGKVAGQTSPTELPQSIEPAGHGDLGGDPEPSGDVGDHQD